MNPTKLVVGLYATLVVMFLILVISLGRGCNRKNNENINDLKREVARLKDEEQQLLKANEELFDRIQQREDSIAKLVAIMDTYKPAPVTPTITKYEKRFNDIKSLPTDSQFILLARNLNRQFILHQCK